MLKQLCKIPIVTGIRTYKVAVLGGAGRIGQLLGLFLKKTPVVTNLSLYDIDHAKGVAMDLSHIERKGVVYGFDGKEELKPCLDKASIVVILAGVPRKPGMSRNDLFTTNATIVAELMVEVAKTCPEAMICIVTNPINSIIPTAATILEHFGVFNWRKLFGVTTLDVVRAIRFISDAKNINPNKLHVEIIGGHCENTIIPVISHCAPPVQFPMVDRERITNRIRTAGTEIVEAKKGQGSATLSTAWACNRFVSSLLDALEGRENVTESAFVKSDETDCEYFSTPLIIGKEGIDRRLNVAQLIDYEINLLKTAIPILKKDIEVGKEFSKQFLSRNT